MSLTSPSSAQASPATLNPALDINSKQFESTRYTEQLLKTKKLRGLLSLDGFLLNEIKGLDTDLQNLVYQNYNKFIAASDTINTMKDHVDEMEKTMQELKKKMNTIVEDGNLINDVFAQRQRKIRAIKEEIAKGDQNNSTKDS